MAATNEEICNEALIMLGVTSLTIADLTSDTSKAAVACRRFFHPLRKMLIRAHPWHFATAYAQLTTEIATLPNDEWEYGYELTSAMLRVWRVLNGISRIETPESRIAFRQYYDITEGGMVLLTDLEDPTIEYSRDVTDPTHFTPEFDQALAGLLAVKIAPAFGAEALKLGDRAFKVYSMDLSVARQIGAGEEQLNEHFLHGDSGFVRSRE